MTFLVDGTLGGTFPSWTTATRPASPANGQMGYNTTTGLFDQYTASGWVSGLTSASQSIPFASLPTGSVLQVVNATNSTDTSTSANTYIDTGLSATITPQFSTSKILVLVNQSGVSKNTNDTRVDLQLLRGSTSICVFELNGGYTGTTGTNRVATSATCYLDSPATTSATVYKTQFKSQSNISNVQVQADGSTSTITLMEISG